MYLRRSEHFEGVSGRGGIGMELDGYGMIPD